MQENSTEKNGSSDRVNTLVGTTVYETPKRVRNPVTEEYETVAELSKGGYKRKFLAVLHSVNSPEVINLSTSPVASFDKDKWELDEREGSYILVRKNQPVDTDTE